MSDDSDDSLNQLEEVAIKFRGKILSELTQMESSTELESGSIEQKLKTYMGFFKLIQSLEEMIKRVQQERDKKSDRGVDILEFRRQLEEQIAKLVDANDEAIIS